MLTVLIVSIVMILLAVGLLSIRILLVKGGHFRGTCAGNSPFLQKEDIRCGVCGRTSGESCGKDKSKTFTPETQA
jgi:hypothetical protein